MTDQVLVHQLFRRLMGEDVRRFIGHSLELMLAEEATVRFDLCAVFLECDVWWKSPFESTAQVIAMEVSAKLLYQLVCLLARIPGENTASHAGKGAGFRRHCCHLPDGASFLQRDAM